MEAASLESLHAIQAAARLCPAAAPDSERFFLIAVMFWLVRTFDLDADVVRLLLGHRREVHTDTLQVQSRDLFIKVLWKDINIILVL